MLLNDCVIALKDEKHSNLNNKELLYLEICCY